jgi:hypothetical protein
MKPGRGDHSGVVVPPPAIYFAFLLGGWGLGQWLGEPSLGLATEVRRGLALVLILGGLLLDGAAAGYFRRLGTPPELYRFSRNPIYLGFAVTYLGLAIAMDSPIALGLLIPCLIVVDRFVIAREERYLSARFGPEYEAYRQKVRRWL